MLQKKPSSKSTKELYRNRSKGEEKNKKSTRIPSHEVLTPKRKIPDNVLYGYTGHLRESNNEPHILGIVKIMIVL